MRRFVVMLLLVGFVIQAGPVSAAGQNQKPAVPQKQVKGQKLEQITLTGRILSRHVRFRRGKSVRGYFLMDDRGGKIALPSVYRVDKNGKVTGMDLKSLKNMRVQIVVAGRTIPKGKGNPEIFIKKILSVTRLDTSKQAPVEAVPKIEPQPAEPVQLAPALR